MKANGIVLGICFVAAAAFVAATSQGMPALAASHFGPGGQADGFMSRDGYVTFMLVLLAGMAALFGGLPALLKRLPTALVNIPNRDYWLAPERLEATWVDLAGMLRWFACALLAFLAYVHYLVVLANEARPPAMPEAAMWGGLVVFFVVLGVWIAALYRRFRRPG